MTRWTWQEDGGWRSAGDPPGAHAGGNAGAREQILERFASKLDEALATTEPLPEPLRALLDQGNDPGQSNAAHTVDDGTGQYGHDLYGLWSAVTAATQEVKLQSRFFKALSDRLDEAALASLRPLLEAQRALLVELHQREDRRRDAVSRTAQHELIELMIDLRDRLQRSADAAIQHRAHAGRTLRPNWIHRIFRKRRAGIQALLDTAAEFDKGYRLTLDRLDDALNRLDVHLIECAGQPFDPNLMAAVDLQETDEVDEGTVLEVYQNGYIRADELLRTAQVKVACAPARPGGTL